MSYYVGKARQSARGAGLQFTESLYVRGTRVTVSFLSAAMRFKQTP